MTAPRLVYYGSEEEFKDAPEFLKHRNIFVAPVAPSLEQYIKQLEDGDKEVLEQLENRVPKAHWKDA